MPLQKKDFPPLNPNAGQIRTISRFQLDEVFLIPFREEEPRKTLIRDFNLLLDELESVKTPVEIWVNGSFATLKEDPNDIDLFIIFDRELLRNRNAGKLSVFLDKDFCRSRYSCDLYWSFRDDVDVVERFRGVYTTAHTDLKPKGFFRIYLNAA
jgi:predicted nucleotidyltransferase